MYTRKCGYFISILLVEKVAESLELEVVLDRDGEVRELTEGSALVARVRHLVLGQEAEDVVPVLHEPAGATGVEEVDGELDGHWCVHMPILLQVEGVVQRNMRFLCFKEPHS